MKGYIICNLSNKQASNTKAYYQRQRCPQLFKEEKRGFFFAKIFFMEGIVMGNLSRPNSNDATGTANRSRNVVPMSGLCSLR